MFMKAKVNKDICIGCGACTSIAEEVFEMDDDGLAVCVKNEVPEDKKEDTIDAMESCPVGAISVDENK